MSITNKTLTQLSMMLEKKECSSVELTKYFLHRITQYDDQLNSFITVDQDAALIMAKAADERRAKNEHTPLTGLPLAHKDIFCTQGLKTTCASKMLENFIPPYNATMVDKLHDAGVVIVGKTNMDEFAMGASNENSYYGATKNPWQLDAVPGGSSGGSAAAVAANLVPAATGTDTGGSIRQPAACCGITGIKPTYGRISRYGLVAFASSLDQAGPMTKTAEDAALLLQYMSGYDATDSTSLNVEVDNYSSKLNAINLHGLKLGLPKQFFSDDLDTNIAKNMQQAIAELTKLGANCVEIDLPNLHLAIPAYYIIAPAECSSNLSRYDGIRFGHRCENPQDIKDLYCRSRSEGFGSEVKRRILIGTHVLSAGYYDQYYIKAQKIRNLIKQDFVKAFTEVDCILSPTMPTTAFKIGEKVADPVQMYLADIYTCAVNLAGLPAISVPTGFHNNLPIGMQLIGNYLNEAKILSIAHQYQQNTDWHAQQPQNFT